MGHLIWKYRELLICIGLFSLALLMRVPGIGNPRVVLSDEGVFASFVQNTVKGEAFFEGHPPLGWYIPSFFIGRDDVSSWTRDYSGTGNGFSGFPMVRLRVFNAILGGIIVVLSYGILRLLGIRSLFSAIPALLITIDHALILYSRIFVPENLLLFFGLSGVFFAFLCVNFRNKKARLSLILAVVSFILLSLSAAVKWSGLGFSIPVVALILLHPNLRGYRLRYISFFSAVFIVTYFSVFFIYSQSFSPGRINPELGFYKSVEIADFDFPKHYSLAEQIKYFLDYNERIYIFQHSYGDFLNNFSNSSWEYDVFSPGKAYLWPLSLNPMNIAGDSGMPVMLRGTRFVWFLGLMGVIYGIFAVFRKQADNMKILSRTVLLAGYFGNYLPFFFIERPMYLYNYFAALIFAFMLFGLLVTDIHRFRGQS